MAGMKAVWFSRHRPNEEQVRDIGGIGYELVGIEEGMRLGAVDIVDWGVVGAVRDGLKRLIRDSGAEAVFGVFPVPIQSFVAANWSGTSLPCFAAWNGRRSQAGGVATFEHLGFMRVGGICV